MSSFIRTVTLTVDAETGIDTWPDIVTGPLLLYRAQMAASARWQFRISGRETARLLPGRLIQVDLVEAPNGQHEWRYTQAGI